MENVGGNASVNEVLKKFESARRERNGAVRIKRSGVTISLNDRNDKAGLPSGRNHREPQHKVEERKQKMTPPRERDFEERIWQAETRGTWRVQQRVRCERREHQICQIRART